MKIKNFGKKSQFNDFNDYQLSTNKINIVVGGSAAATATFFPVSSDKH